jgi:hypothetical protein
MMKSFGGATARQLVSCVGPTQYGVHGHEVYYCPCGDGPDTPVHAIDPNTGHDRVVGILENGGPFKGVPVSPDGKTILYQRQVREGRDLMLIDNFK